MALFEKNSLRKLLKKLKAGDQSAFMPFYQKVAPNLMRFLLWKTGGDKPLSEDVLQEAFVRFLIHLDQVESEEDIAIYSYLLRIVKNCLVDKTARASMVFRNQVGMEEISPFEMATESNAQEKAVELRELQIAMSALSEKESEILWLKDGMGLSHKELAKEFGMTEEASRQAYSRAKKSLLSQVKSLMGPGEMAYANS